jgi:hypothetical protein
MPNLVEVNYGRTGKSTNISGKIVDYVYDEGLKLISGK